MIIVSTGLSKVSEQNMYQEIAFEDTVVATSRKQCYLDMEVIEKVSRRFDRFK